MTMLKKMALGRKNKKMKPRTKISPPLPHRPPV